MACFICTACGSEFADSGAAPPPRCPVCEDARQFVPASGQGWTTPQALRAKHTIGFRAQEAKLIGVGCFPDFAIAQRALLVRTPAGNMLWDCLSLLDDATVEIIGALGGLAAIAISHPHYYGNMVEWGRAFRCPVLLHAADRDFVMRPDSCLDFWEGETRPVLPGLTLHRLGGHFPGATVLHWEQGAEGRGALLAGDIASVAPDRRHVSFMWSYPNWVPLPAAEVSRIGQRLAALEFDRVYGAWWDRVIASDGKAAVARSVARYVAALN
jgi:glyoxylase-like metal-dependent hydrolase (beta-lactamase superfamily II)